MHPAVGNRAFVENTLKYVRDQVDQKTAEVREAISQILGSVDTNAIEKQRGAYSTYLNAATNGITAEAPHGDVHFVSRIDVVGLFQSILAKIFCNTPDLQGYGDKNPSWVTTVIEQIAYDADTFFKRVYTDVHGDKKPLLHSILAELKQLRDERAPFPPGTPKTISLAENAKIALLSDWGGDNGAAKRIAGVVKRQNLDIGIHLGDI